jgi:hypothetical protein
METAKIQQLLRNPQLGDNDDEEHASPASPPRPLSPSRTMSPPARALSPPTRALSPPARTLSPPTRAVSPAQSPAERPTRAVSPQTSPKAEARSLSPLAHSSELAAKPASPTSQPTAPDSRLRLGVLLDSMTSGEPSVAGTDASRRLSQMLAEILDSDLNTAEKRASIRALSRPTTTDFDSDMSSAVLTSLIKDSLPDSRPSTQNFDADMASLALHELLTSPSPPAAATPSSPRVADADQDMQDLVLDAFEEILEKTGSEPSLPQILQHLENQQVQTPPAPPGAGKKKFFRKWKVPPGKTGPEGLKEVSQPGLKKVAPASPPSPSQGHLSPAAVPKDPSKWQGPKGILQKTPGVKAPEVKAPTPLAGDPKSPEPRVVPAGFDRPVLDRLVELGRGLVRLANQVYQGDLNAGLDMIALMSEVETAADQAGIDVSALTASVGAMLTGDPAAAQQTFNADMGVLLATLRQRLVRSKQ